MPSRNREQPAAGSGLVVAAMCAPALLVMINITSVAVAIPEIGRSLRADQSQIQWIIDSYPLVLAALLLPAGALLDRFGRKRGVVVGLGGLAAAFVWSSLADSAGEMILSRCLAGFSAAILLPGTLATITTVVPAARRGAAVALWAGSMVIGGTLGVLVGGVGLSVAWWGSIFVVSAIGAVLCLVLAAVVAPETRDPEHSNLDPVGALLSVVGIGALVLGITEGPVRGWTDPVTAGALLMGPVALVAFGLWELRNPRPMLDLRLFKNRSFGVGSLLVFLAFLATYGWFFMAVQYYAYLLGFDALESGLALLPCSVLIIPLALTGPALAARYGRGPVFVVALAVMAATGAGMAVLGGEADYWLLVPPFAFFVGGLGLLSGPATEAIVESLPPARQGVASAVNDVARELGAAVGIAIAGSAFNGAYRARVGELLDSAVSPLAEVARSSPAAGLQAAAGAGPAGEDIAGAVHHGVVAGWTAAMIVLAVVCAAGAAYVVARFPALSKATREDRAPALG